MNQKAGIFVAGIAVGAAAMAVVYFVDLGSTATPPVATQKQKPAPSPTVQSGVVLMPGEQLVAAPEAAKPAPAETPAVAPSRSPAPATPRYNRPSPPVVAQAPRAPAPPPQYSRAERRDSFARNVCLNCGVVTAVTRGDYDWEVRVRFDDGTRQTLRYYDRPRLQVGDTFHLEDGRLIPD